jgi:ankyrin repeat protein
MNGFDVNIRDIFDNTPLHCALGFCDPTGTGVGTSVLMYLLGQENVDVNIKGRNGHNLLHKACEKINKLSIDIFHLLIETHGCDVNVQNNAKNTPIHSALDQFKPSDGGDINALV